MYDRLERRFHQAPIAFEYPPHSYTLAEVISYAQISKGSLKLTRGEREACELFCQGADEPK